VVFVLVELVVFDVVVGHSQLERENKQKSENAKMKNYIFKTTERWYGTGKRLRK
jgi:hypothetical protein